MQVPQLANTTDEPTPTNAATATLAIFITFIVSVFFLLFSYFTLALAGHLHGVHLHTVQSAHFAFCSMEHFSLPQHDFFMGQLPEQHPEKIKTAPTIIVPNNIFIRTPLFLRTKPFFI
jgi:hypothetical protein